MIPDECVMIWEDWHFSMYHSVWSSQESDTCTIEHSRVHLPGEYFKSSCSGVLLPKTQIFVPFFTEQEGPPTPKPRPKHAGGCPKHVDAPHSLLPVLAQHPKLRLVFLGIQRSWRIWRTKRPKVSKLQWTSHFEMGTFQHAPWFASQHRKDTSTECVYNICTWFSSK